MTDNPTQSLANTRERIGVVLAQVGSPRTPAVAEVRRYLREFLSDPHIIDIPRWRWRPILQAILAVRPAKVARQYREIWTPEGSPLMVISATQRAGVQERLGARFQVEVGLAYSHQSIAVAMARLTQAGISKVVVLPMFPQYSHATVGSIYDDAMAAALGRTGRGMLPKKQVPALRFVAPFFADPAYIQVLAASIRRQLAAGPEPDRILVGFHGLPKRFVDAGDPYQGQCEQTLALLAAQLDWRPDQFEMAYQSRFGRAEWIQPYLQPRLQELHAAGVKRPVLVAPGFTTDCLETLHELGIAGRELFAAGGGDPDAYRVLSAVNDEPAWLDYLAHLIESNALGW